MPESFIASPSSRSAKVLSRRATSDFPRTEVRFPYQLELCVTVLPWETAFREQRHQEHCFWSESSLPLISSVARGAIVTSCYRLLRCAVSGAAQVLRHENGIDDGETISCWCRRFLSLPAGVRFLLISTLPIRTGYQRTMTAGRPQAAAALDHI